jgi:Flp pilus assembly pilin Flp
MYDDTLPGPSAVRDIQAAAAEVGLPATIVMGFVVLIMSMANIGARLQWLWTQSLVQTRTLVGLS